MNIKEGEFGSFLVIEDEKEISKKKSKISNLKSSAKKSQNNKNDIIIFDEKTKKNKIISDDYPNEEIDNSFLKKNEFCIYSNTKNTKEKKINAKLTREYEENQASSRLFKIEEEKPIIKRSDSFNFNSRVSTLLFINKIQNEKKDKDISGFINLIETKDHPDAFQADCVLYDKKYNSFNGTITVDTKFKCSFKLEEKSKKSLYYNEDYYIFSLLEVKNYNTNTTYIWKDEGVEINLKDYRYFLLKFKNKYREFIDILDTFATPEQNSSFLKNAITRCNYLKNKFDINGWDIYNFDKEFKRQNVDFKYTHFIIDNSNFYVHILEQKKDYLL